MSRSYVESCPLQNKNSGGSFLQDLGALSTCRAFRQLSSANPGEVHATWATFLQDAGSAPEPATVALLALGLAGL